MDSECTAANVQPLVDDGTAPSAAVSQTARRRRASESTEARERRLEREEAASCLRNCGGEREALVSAPSSGQGTACSPRIVNECRGEIVSASSSGQGTACSPLVTSE